MAAIFFTCLDFTLLISISYQVFNETSLIDKYTGQTGLAPNEPGPFFPPTTRRRQGPWEPVGRVGEYGLPGPNGSTGPGRGGNGP